PFTSAPGYQVGVDLVAAGFAAPDALGRTVTIVTSRLPDHLEPDAALAPRLGALVESLVTGYARGLRSRTLDEQEAIRRATVVAREQAQRALRDSEARLRHAAQHDPLTGLPNRALFAQHLADAIADPAPDARVGVCVLDLDGFTLVNNSLGHEIGDRLLV